MISCPRCRAAAADCRAERVGRQADQPVWTIYYCTRCSFTWRDTEPARSIDPAQREPFFQLDPARPDAYPYNIPPPHRRQ